MLLQVYIFFNIDLTITTEKLVELFKTEGEQLVVDNMGCWLGLPFSKRRELKENYHSPTQQRDAYLDLYARDHPHPSWRTVARVLRDVILPDLANMVERTYVQGTPTTL